MGYQLREVVRGKHRHYFLICDCCGFEVDTLHITPAEYYKEKNNWLTIKNNKYNFKMFNGDWVKKEFCNTCAKALGYIIDKG